MADDLDRWCEDMHDRAIAIRQYVERLKTTPIERLPPRRDLEQLRADLHRMTIQLRFALQEGRQQ
jgi:hypothetical protein